jgi:hypothetical protein
MGAVIRGGGISWGIFRGLRRLGNQRPAFRSKKSIVSGEEEE